MKILIVEDEKRLAGIMKQGLEEQAFIVDLAHDGEEGLYMAQIFLMMPCCWTSCFRSWTASRS